MCTPLGTLFPCWVLCNYLELLGVLHARAWANNILWVHQYLSVSQSLTFPPKTRQYTWLGVIFRTLFNNIFLVLLCATKFIGTTSLNKWININKELQFIMISPGILPPQPHVASLLPPLEQKLQQWNVPWCGCMLRTHMWNGLPCCTQSQFLNCSIMDWTGWEEAQDTGRD